MEPNEIPPLAQPVAIPYARPIEVTPTLPPAGRAVLQTLIVFVVFLAWQISYGLVLADRVRAIHPAAVLYVHVVGLAVLSLAAVAIVTAGDPAPRAGLGLAGPFASRDIGLGLLFIIPCYVANIVVSLIYVATSTLDVEKLASDKMENLDMLGSISLAGVLPVSILIGIYEEILFRGFLLSRIRAVLGGANSAAGATLAVLISSVLFGAGHYYQGLLGVMQTTVVGLVLGIVAVRRRSIWACIIAHIGIDTLGLFLLKIIWPMVQEYLPAATQPA